MIKKPSSYKWKNKKENQLFKLMKKPPELVEKLKRKTDVID